MCAMLTKAGALYELCEFEHSMALFTRASHLAPDSQVARDGILKCRKTILNRLEDDTVFSFNGAKSFINLLRKKGHGSVEQFLEKKDARTSFQFATTALGLGSKASVMDSKKAKAPKKKGQSVKDRMKEDRRFLESLQTKLSSSQTLEDNSVR